MSSFDLERLNLEENLRQSRRKCEDLEENVARLLEDMKVSKDREKRADERRDKTFAELMKMTIEKNESVSKLNDNINELKVKILENERLLEVHKEKCKCLDIKVANMDRDKFDAVKTIDELRAENSEANRIIDELRAENSEANRIIDELRAENSEANRIIDELRAENSEANRVINELKLRKSEVNEVAELYKKIDEGLSVILTVEAGKRADIADMAELYGKIGKFATSEGMANSEFPGSKGKNDSSGNATEIVSLNATSPGVRKSPISTGSKNSGLSKKGERYSVQRRTREDDDDARTVNTPHVSQPVCDSLQVESNKRKEPLGSGASASVMRLKSVARCSTKSTRSPSVDARDVIEIIESDDETNSNENAHVPNRVLDSKLSENKMNLVQSPSSKQRSKRKRTGFGDGFFVNSTTKKNRNMCPSSMDTLSVQKKENQTLKLTTTHDGTGCSLSRKCAGDEVGLTCGTQTPVKKFKNDLKDEDAESSDDESLSDSRMVDLVASLRNKSTGRKIVFEADMLRAINQDTELCLNAVCALYRQEVIGKKLKGRSNSFKNGGFSPIDSISGRALAEYLIDGDKELKLRKSVAEVKNERPDVIGQCRKLASIYVEKLHEIYSSEVDPLFSQS